MATPDIAREISDATLETAAALGVAVGTLRRWQGRMLPLGRTFGEHRRYQRDTVRAALGAEPAATGKTVCYARVSSHDQALQLKTLALRLKKHCVDAGFTDVEVISDLGRGLNCRNKGLQRLLQELLRGRVARLVLVTKDRLLCFGSALLAGTAVCPAKENCVSRFLHVKTNGGNRSQASLKTATASFRFVAC